MTLEEFRTYVDLYSADLSRWPQDQAISALRLMDQSVEAKDYFERDLQLMELLQGYAPAATGLPALEERILQAVIPASGELTETDILPPLRWTWLTLPGGGLLAAAVLGFMIGMHSVQTEFLLDPIFYDEDQVIHSGSEFYDEGVF